MFGRLNTLFLVLFLSGCGVSAIRHQEYVTFLPLDNAVEEERKTFVSEGLSFRKVFTNQKKQFEGEVKEFAKNKIVISFAKREGGFAGVLPLLPPPPVVPVFLNDMTPVCPAQNDVMMSVRLLTEDEGEIKDYFDKSEINKIYLINDDGRVLLPRQVFDYNNEYVVCFPLSYEVINAFVLVDYKKAAWRLRYYNDYTLVMGYLGNPLLYEEED